MEIPTVAIGIGSNNDVTVRMNEEFMAWLEDDGETSIAEMWIGPDEAPSPVVPPFRVLRRYRYVMPISPPASSSSSLFSPWLEPIPFMSLTPTIGDQSRSSTPTPTMNVSPVASPVASPTVILRLVQHLTSRSTSSPHSMRPRDELSSSSSTSSSLELMETIKLRRDSAHIQSFANLGTSERLRIIESEGIDVNPFGTDHWPLDTHQEGMNMNIEEIIVPTYWDWKLILLVMISLPIQRWSDAGLSYLITTDSMMLLIKILH
ncbi:hypothetical protein K504DRAFT_497617 [Pleomassaria siparia CBS 279.74]|uniref:Uncharacterized protein n=1 Tax=Pleomassaria siparia CBS 279.74 TaxID=1314801 RepID=A0A6G1KS87_9PLEO|nr:hypothetical protein K504DRAFT_497617 [Pleomassaria siparia CBS 279.74]